MLRITVQESDHTISMRLEGRVAGPWLAELSRAWDETAPRLGEKKFEIDLHNVTYSDAAGKELLRNIYAQSKAELITRSPLTQYLAEEIRKSN